MARQRRPRTSVVRRFGSGRSGRISRPVERASARDTVIMAVIAIAFIGAFWFALSRPSTVDLQSPPEAPTSAEPASANIVPSTAPQTARQAAQPDETSFPCEAPTVTDGDTIRCGVLRVRLASIDAPEMPGHCRRGRTCVDGDPYASKAHLERLIGSSPLSCRQTDTDHYGRVVALCEAGGRDLSCAQVQAGHAIVRYGDLSCTAR